MSDQEKLVQILKDHPEICGKLLEIARRRTTEKAWNIIAEAVKEVRQCETMIGND